MRETLIPALNRQQTRRGSPEDNMRPDSSINFRGNFHCVVEVTSGQAAREKARRGQ